MNEKLNSLELAELVGREHKNVLRDIRNLIKKYETLNLYTDGIFKKSFYKCKSNRERLLYEISKKGLEVYLLSMTGEIGLAVADFYTNMLDEKGK